MKQTVTVEGVNFCWIFVKHGRCWRWHDGCGRDGVGERREGMLVCMLVCVLVLVLMLVELGPQVGRWSQGGPTICTLGGQKSSVEFLPKKILL